MVRRLIDFAPELAVVLGGLLVLALVLSPLYAPAADCMTDADCAAWEASQGTPDTARCYGAPCAPFTNHQP